MSYRKMQRFDTDKALLAFSSGNIFGKSITLEENGIPFDENGNKSVPSGMFVAEKADGSYRFLPRATVKTAIATNSPTIAVSPVIPFEVGEALYILEPHTILTITAVTAAQTQTITVNGITATATASTGVNADLAILVANAVNTTGGINSEIYAIASGDSVYLFPKDGKSLLGVTEGGTATATLSGATMAYNNTAIGTIASINAVAKTITLGANAAVAVPVGVNIGTRNIKNIIGMCVGGMDLTEQNRVNLAILTESSGVREHLLPYFEEGFRKMFPKVIFSKNI